MNTKSKVFHRSLALKLHQWHDSQSDPVYQVGSLIKSGKPISEENGIECVKSLSNSLNVVKLRDPFQTRTIHVLEILYLLYEFETWLYPVISQECPNFNDLLGRFKGGFLQSAYEKRTTLAPVEVKMLLRKEANLPPPVSMGGLLPFQDWQILFKEDDEVIVYGLRNTEAIARIRVDVRPQ